jgi:RNA polymerase sigma-70 factor, ECF subfamily
VSLSAVYTGLVLAAASDSGSSSEGPASSVSPRNEAHLIEAARNGDRLALEALSERLLPPLLRAVRALMGKDDPDNEDLCHEILLAVLEALPSFRGESTLLHFAIRIAVRRTTRARRRSRSILGWLEHLYLGERALLPKPGSPHKLTLADRRRELLRSLLGALPEAQAETLVLRTVLGHSIEEVSAITAVPINTVRSRLRLAKEALRRRIESDPSTRELLGGEE